MSRPILRSFDLMDADGESWPCQILGPSDRPDNREPEYVFLVVRPDQGWPEGDEARFDLNDLLWAVSPRWGEA